MTRRYPLASLLAASGLTITRLRDHVHMNSTQYRTLIDEGLTELQADRWAIRLGLLAYDVWPEILDAAIDDAMVVCAAPDCDERFIPPANYPSKRWCHCRCAKRTQARERYATDHAYREHTKARVAAYGTEAHAVRLRKQAAYRARNRELLKAKARARRAAA